MTEPFHPGLQIAFAVRLEQLEEEQFGPALARAITSVGVAAIDTQLQTFVSPESLSKLAVAGLRGETFFPIPALLRANPRLLAYYRLLYGLSQKELFRGGLQRFKKLEDVGSLTPTTESKLEEIVRVFVETGTTLLDNLGSVSLQRIRDLQLLTLGPQLRGSRLNTIGQAATEIVFRRIRQAISDDNVVSESNAEIVILNSAGRKVHITFSSDPDIAVIEDLNPGVVNRLAVEIKGGTDGSNIHNRLGEAEKSHGKAKDKGFTEFWTIINVSIPIAAARAGSRTTNEFFQLSQITDPSDPEWIRFREAVASRLGVPASK